MKLRCAVPLAMLVAAVACGAKDTARSPDAGEAPVACEGLGAVADLSYALAGGTFRDASSDHHALAATDEVLGYLAALDDALKSQPSNASLQQQSKQLSGKLRERRSQIEATMGLARESYEAARTRLEAAATCEGVDLRKDDSKPPKKCRSAVRLWTAAGEVKLRSAVDSRSVAQHIRELRLDETTSGVRDALAEALLAHSEHLTKLHDIIKPPGNESELAELRHDLQEGLADTMTACLSTMSSNKRVESKGAEPRDATVVVRPQYPEPVAEVFGDMHSFGSGFVVQWRTADGDLETRIVTNGHVMSGAREAEISIGDEVQKKSGNPADQPEPIRATLVRSLPYDDIAILKVEDSPRARELLARGLAFRRAPIDDREPIVAAGFPGVGSVPSYQVSEGTVSNARFGGRDDDQVGVTGYIQHTAAIDPGNSGGPLLDAKGNVVGVNTLKLVGRENVGLAIPVARVQFAMTRVEERSEFTVDHAQAACNLVVAGLTSDTPAMGAVDRLGLALYDGLRDGVGAAKAVEYRRHVEGSAYGAADRLRGRIYGAIRADLDAQDGIAPFTTCTDVAAESDGQFTARVRTRKGSGTVTLREEDGMLRVVQLAL